MFCDPRLRTLISMSETDWSDVGVSELPTGTVTLLLADVEGSTRLWESQPDDMTAALARLDQVLSDVVAGHDGVRPVEQGEGDSFVIAFARASDAVACALDLQRAPLAPIKLRIGVHTGEVRLRDEGNYIGPTINRTARLRDLAHGGQTVLSGTTQDLVIDVLPEKSSLTDLGSHPLRDLPRPERVVQLCHPDLHNDFPPLRTIKTVVSHNLPVQLTSFVGRQSEIKKVREVLAENRLVTLTGAGGAGKTRLAVQVATELAAEFSDGVCYVDLAPITHPDVVAVTVARGLDLPDQPDRSTVETLLRHLHDRQTLIVLDNCEHLIDSSAALVVALLGGAPGLTLLATSREPLGVTGEATWQVPSLSLADDAVDLFADRARLARTDFTVDENAAAVAEICRRLDGMPLAIELAAARVRALSLDEIVDSLHDRFRLLTGGSRTAVRRQQTLRASVDWSHALLTESERILFRRLAVFLGGFDLDAAQAVAGSGGLERYQVLDQLTLLVDKSLVVAESTGGRTRYRLLETVRQYALEKLGESGEANVIRERHCDHYSSMAALLDTPARTDYERLVESAEIEMDNLRGALGWSLENSDVERALALASSLHPLWSTHGRVREGRAWFNTVFAEGDSRLPEVAPAVRARALADQALLDTWGMAAPASMEHARQALAIAREVDDPALLARALTACGLIAGYSYQPDVAAPYFDEAIGLARALDDRWRLCQILAYQAYAAFVTGDVIAAGAAAEEGRDLAKTIGDRSDALECGAGLGWAWLMRGDIVPAITHLRELLAEAEATHAIRVEPTGLHALAIALAHHGDENAARAAAEAALDVAADLGDFYLGMGYSAVATAALAAGDVEAAREAGEEAWRHMSVQPQVAADQRPYNAEVTLAAGDLPEARRLADETIATTTGLYVALAFATRARVSLIEGDRTEAENDAHDALACVMSSGAHLMLPDILECLADLARDVDNQRAARLFGAAEAFRQHMGMVRFRVYDAGHQDSVAPVRDAMGEEAFDAAWAEGAALSTEEAIAYAQRGRGERKRPATGWESLTPAEREVVRLVCDGLASKDIAARLFVSPRTVHAHLSHVYTKLGLASRVQLVQEAARRV